MHAQDSQEPKKVIQFEQKHQVNQEVAHKSVTRQKVSKLYQRAKSTHERTQIKQMNKAIAKEQKIDKNTNAQGFISSKGIKQVIRNETQPTPKKRGSNTQTKLPTIFMMAQSTKRKDQTSKHIKHDME